MGNSDEASIGLEGVQSPHKMQKVHLNPAGKKKTGLFGQIRSRLLRLGRDRYNTMQNQDGTDSQSTTSSAGGASPPALGLGALRRLRVNDVAVPKAEIVAVPIGINRDELIEVFRAQGFSRLPVYDSTLDQPKGLILFKDIALRHDFCGGTELALRSMLRPLLYAPPSMAADVLLKKMQRERLHMALVIDEYGGVDGLVTIEDLIETVIGEIEDEHDEVEGPLWKAERAGVILAQAIAPLNEFEAQVRVRLRTQEEDEDIGTLGGLVFRRAGRVPVRGEIIKHETGTEFEVVDADLRHIKRLRVLLPGTRLKKTSLSKKASKPHPKT